MTTVIARRMTRGVVIEEHTMPGVPDDDVQPIVGLLRRNGYEVVAE